MHALTTTALMALSMATMGISQIHIRTQPVPRPPSRSAPNLRVPELRVTASILDGIATTELSQTIHNDGNRVAEATWILPLPARSTADHFTMTVGGKVMTGEILDPAKARKIYEDIVRRQRDPGLLEYFGKGCLRARVFPIPAKGSIEVRVRYRQILDEAAGLHRWDFPVRAAGLPGRPAERITLDLKIHSKRPILNVYSPLTGVDIIKKGEHEARASFELKGGQMPERDLSVFYGVSTKAFGLDVLTYSKGEGKGHFTMLLAPQHDWPEPKNTVKIVQFVLDTSGSMQGKKIEQAREALRFFVKSLKPGDYFNIIPFSTEARPFFEKPVRVDETTLAKAMTGIAELEARGGTNIEDALTSALSAAQPTIQLKVTVIPSIVSVCVFLTDGLPTVGTTNIQAILKQAKIANKGRARIFVFGVGHDVNTQLLDKIAAESRGDRDYVRENENIEVKTGALFTKLSNPVMTDLKLQVDGITIKDRYPRDLPDLFKGGRLLIVGRYQGHGHKAIRLSGLVDGARREYVFETKFPEKDKQNDFVPVLWAQRRIAGLLEAIRLNGRSKELQDEIRRVGRQFGIVTPFTSHLIVEDGMRVSRARGFHGTPGASSGGDSFYLGAERSQPSTLGRLRRELMRKGKIAKGESKKLAGLVAASPSASSEARASMDSLDRAHEGDKAIANSVQLRKMMKASSRSKNRGPRNLTTVWVHDRNFHLAGGIWVDDSFKATMRGKERSIVAYSDEYFQVLKNNPELAPYFAFSSAIVIVVAGQAIEIK